MTLPRNNETPPGATFSLDDLEAWIYKGFSGLFHLAFNRANKNREVPVADSTIKRLETLAEELQHMVLQLEALPIGTVSPDEWDAWHIMCFRFLLNIIRERLMYGKTVRGQHIVQTLGVELTRLKGVIAGYKKLNERLQQ